MIRRSRPMLLLIALLTALATVAGCAAIPDETPAQGIAAGDAGGKAAPVPDPAPGLQPADLVRVDDALTRLEQIDARKAKIVELRFFAGLSIEDAAEILKISPATVKREWAMAKAFLTRQMKLGFA